MSWSKISHYQNKNGRGCLIWICSFVTYVLLKLEFLMYTGIKTRINDNWKLWIIFIYIGIWQSVLIFYYQIFFTFIFWPFVYSVLFGVFLFVFFRKSQKGRNIILAILDNIGLQKGKVKLFLNLLFILEISVMSFKPRTTIFFIGTSMLIFLTEFIHFNFYFSSMYMYLSYNQLTTGTGVIIGKQF